MGKTIKTLCILITILFSTNAYASPQGMANYPWMLMNVPVWCGPLNILSVFRTISFQ